MITLTLDWREVIWWLQGGMAGSHLRWNVYEDMVNRVWPQCTEQERRSMWLVMRRDLGLCWRKHWQGMDFDKPGEGEWRDDITDKTPWMYFRQVLARFNPENQYAVTLPIKSEDDLIMSVNGLLGKDSIIDAPTRYVSHQGREMREAFDIKTHPYLTLRAYGWKDPNGADAYFIDWRRRCDPERIAKVKKLDIPDDGTM